MRAKIFLSFFVHGGGVEMNGVFAVPDPLLSANINNMSITQCIAPARYRLEYSQAPSAA